jgi:hypothetical protein
VNLPLGVTEFGKCLVVPGGNFYWWELAMKPKPEHREQWGVYHDVPEELRPNGRRLVSELLQPARNVLGPLSITPRGGVRLGAFNVWSGGAKHSQHPLCKAADIKSATLSPERLRRALLRLWATGVINLGGIGLYPTFVHVDIRDRLPGQIPARWSKLAGGGD